MAGDVMLQLGRFQFSVSTAAYEKLARDTSWRWPAQTRVGQTDALQYTGPDNDNITLDGVIYGAWHGGTGQLDAMRAQGNQGVPFRLVDGRGNILGLWVILSVREGQSLHARAGVPRKQEFTIQIRKYSDGLAL